MAQASEVWDPPISFESEAAEVDCMLQELDQEEHSFFLGCCEEYFDSDVDSDILDLVLADSSQEQSKFNGTMLQALLVAHKDSVATELVVAEKLVDHKVLLVHHDNTQHLS